jgi:lipopolysaccharide export system ATP-binding protein
MMPAREEIQAGELLLEASGLAKSYHGRRVVDGVAFNVRAGEIVGLLGPNGAGKSTTFRMTVGLVPPDEGSVSLLGKECSRLPMYKRARLGMGYLPQEPSIFRRMTVEGNLLAVLETMPLTRSQRKEECARLLADLELTHLSGNVAETLSGGERRRLELSRALATRPAVLLLDEPFAGVDPINVHEIQELVERMRSRGIGILITDHNVRETLQITDRSYIIHAGKILREGDAEFLVKDAAVREVYLGRNFDVPIAGGVSGAEADAIINEESE